MSEAFWLFASIRFLIKKAEGSKPHRAVKRKEVVDR